MLHIVHVADTLEGFFSLGRARPSLARPPLRLPLPRTAQARRGPFRKLVQRVFERLARHAALGGKLTQRSTAQSALRMAGWCGHK